MQQIFSKQALNSVSFLFGNIETVEAMQELPVMEPFCEEVIEFLDTVSIYLLRHPNAHAYPDVATLGFWLRKASIIQMRDKYLPHDNNYHLGRGTVFHIAPSNVPVNYAYSLCAGILTGNANIVRLPSKHYPQIEIINQALSNAIVQHPLMKRYICLVRYDKDITVNDMFSSIADVRIIWGGDSTIEEVRKSPLPPRSTDIPFSDRFSFAVINSDTYLAANQDAVFARGFYNDTFLIDQNACTSPHLIVWTGSQREQAKNRFWSSLHELVLREYVFQPIMGINKMTDALLVSVALDGACIVPHEDNSIVRISISKPSRELIELRGNSGFFFEYDCEDLMSLRELCLDTRCQTLSFIGNKEEFLPLLKSGIKGIDRIVPLGHTMDFGLLWDGFNLTERLVRTVAL